MLPYLYFMKVMVCSTILMSYYYVALRNKIYHQYNRFYLLFAVVLSWCIPLISFKINVEQPAVHPTLYKAITYISGSEGNFEPDIIISAHTSILTLDNILYLLYILGALLIAIFTIQSIVKVFLLQRKYKYQKIEDYKLYQTQEPSTPFSFF